MLFYSKFIARWFATVTKMYKDVQEVKGSIVGIMRKLPECLADRWKKKLDIKKFATYKSLYLEIKKSKYSYRHLFDPKSFSSSLKSKKSLVNIHCLPLQDFLCFK